jgi:D-alanine transaminase
MSKIAYVNGAYLPQSEACVNIEDRGYQFGDGIYEVVHVHRGRFVDEDRHLGRLERSLKEIRLPMPMPLKALRLVLLEVLRRNRITADGLVYMQVSRGVAPRDHAFPKVPVPVSFVVTAKRVPAYPTNLDATAIAAITYPDLRWARCDIKTINLLPNVLARQAAREAGAAEAILYNEATGMVMECAATSFWIVDAQGALRTRYLDQSILPGCTRGAVIAELEAAGIAYSLEEFSLEEMRAARETFLTSATGFVKPITKIDGQDVADGKVGPVTRRLFEIFTRHVNASAGNAA